MRFRKICLKLSFSHFKWVLQAILSLTVLSNCVSVSLTVRILTPLFSLTLPAFVLFFMSLDGKFNGDSKTVIKSVIFSLQVCFTGDFVPDCPFKLCF